MVITYEYQHTILILNSFKLSASLSQFNYVNLPEFFCPGSICRSTKLIQQVENTSISMDSTSTSSSSSRCLSIFDDPSNPLFKPKGKKSTVVHQLDLQNEQVEKNSTSASTSFSFTKEQCQQSLAMLGTQIQSFNFDYANKEVQMANNVIQPATHSNSMAEFVANNSSDPGSWVRNGTTNPIPNFSKQLSIASLFPAYNSDTETDAS
nr:hypothetical protein CFP56_77155 [Quercus suber]